MRRCEYLRIIRFSVVKPNRGGNPGIFRSAGVAGVVRTPSTIAEVRHCSTSLPNSGGNFADTGFLSLQVGAVKR